MPGPESQLPHIEIPTVCPHEPLRISLISTFSRKHGASIDESLGPEALAGDLIGEFDTAVSVTHTDLQLHLNPDGHASVAESISAIKDDNPHAIGISVKIGALDQLDSVLEHIDDRWENQTKPLVVLGGVVPSFASLELLSRYPNVILAMKEGEMAMRGIYRWMRGDTDISQVPGITYRNDLHETITTQNQKLDLSQRHLPARITTQQIVHDLGGKAWAEASRGCSFNCTFCSIRELRDGGFDGSITVESVIEDLTQLKNMGIDTISFTDDDFGGNPERTLEIAEAIIEANLDITFSISSRADHVYIERPLRNLGTDQHSDLDAVNARLRYIMERLHAAGLERVFIGMESGSPTQLTKRYGKQVSVEGNYKALEILRDIGIDVVAGFIPVDQLMTLDELSENITFLRNTGMWSKVTNPLSVLRVQAGSAYLRMVDNAGLLGDQTKDLVFYEASFRDPSVEKIARRANAWVDNLYQFMFGLKGEVAILTLGDNSQNSPQIIKAEQLLTSFKRLELDFIGAMLTELQGFPQSNLNQIEASHGVQRDQLIQQAARLVEEGVFNNNGQLSTAIAQLSAR